MAVALWGMAACGGTDADDDATAPAVDADSTTASAPESDGGRAPWEGDACDLLSDDEVAAVFDGTPPTGSQSASEGTVAAEDYGGSSCRWDVTASRKLNLDVFPSGEGRLDELAAYDPWDRWYVEPLGGVGDDARVLLWNGETALDIAPGSVGALVVEQGAVGLRLELTAGWPGEPDGLVAAAQAILDRS